MDRRIKLFMVLGFVLDFGRFKALLSSHKCPYILIGLEHTALIVKESL